MCHPRRMISAFLKGLAVTPVAGFIGTVIAILALSLEQAPTRDTLTFMLIYGTAIGSLFAAPATIGLFPVLYAIWPKRTRSAFAYVMGLSVVGGFFSPFLYLEVPPPMFLDSLNLFIGGIGMISAAILTPWYFHWTRRPVTIITPRQ